MLTQTEMLVISMILSKINLNTGNHSMQHALKLALILCICSPSLEALREKIVNGNPFRTGNADAVIEDFRRQVGKREVITFIGYSGRGYQNPEKMLKQARIFLSMRSPQEAVVNIGVTPEGIGAIYPLAKKMGFETFGIVSTQASDYLDGVKNVDHPYLVRDETWGGYQNSSQIKLNPTSAAMVAVSDVMVAYGAGDIGLAELRAGQSYGKTIKAYVYDENHEKSINKALKAGKEAPKIFHLPAFAEFSKRLGFSQRKIRRVPRRDNQENRAKKSKSSSGTSLTKQ
ncbi:MAG: hypothetical protein C0582_05760 [Alphaproteobacteria bacterium]|nr:MAG: hypothetical protein C0582_05760 [Alphaproteobacteria bacterium]